MNKKSGLKIIALLMCVSLLAGCAAQQQTAETTGQASAAAPAISFEANPGNTPGTEPGKTLNAAPRYIFLFIGDGMSFAQVQAAQIYPGQHRRQD